MKKSDLPMFDIRGKVIVLTGSAGLLGTQYANILSSAGANVILIDINFDRNKNLEKNLALHYHTKPMAVQVDISNKEEIERLGKKIISKYGKIDGLINNAAFTKKHPLESAPFEKYPLELWEDIIKTNLTGVFLCCQEFGKIMVKQKSGVIVNISSIYGMVGADQRIYGKSKINSVSSYAATKGAIINLSRFLAAYWQGKNIRVNTLTLGGVYNNQDKIFIKKYSNKTILGRMAKPDEYNGALLFLVSDASSYMTGANLVVDGGWTAW